MKATHILDWRTVAPGAERKTLCGLAARIAQTTDADGVTLHVIPHEPRVNVANDPHDATCRKCRKKRDGR